MSESREQVAAQKAYDEWEAWHSEICEEGEFEGKRYVSYPDMGSLGSEKKFVEVVARALAACALAEAKWWYTIDNWDDAKTAERIAALERAAEEKS